uniref:SPG11 vesicle trafficking associated, spatacsin n=1 Tax=Neolamprologus brichardi TaxID=32507 RepID=A0A3Q4HKL3_NEOBR
MLEADQRLQAGSTEVAVIPENQHCGDVADVRKAELAPGGSLLGCLGVRGQLVVWDPADREPSPAAVEDSDCDELIPLCTAEQIQSHDLSFRMFPDHLLCAAPRSRPPLQPQHPRDQDSLSSSSFSISALGATFSTDRSWEARLNSMYSRAKQATAPSSSCFASSQPPRTSSWFSSLPHLDPHLAPSSSHSRVPPGGMTVAFAVPESSASSQLTVSEFSALLTFVRPGNQQTTVALWDMEYGNVRYHQAAGEAAPVQRCGERQHRLLLKKAGVFQVLFSVSQQDLLSRLMLFGSAATVDAVCHLNSWGRCSIPIHALKNKFYFVSTVRDICIKQFLCPALDLLCSAVRDSNSEAQSRQFSEQLLNITLSFVNTQIRSVLSNTHHEDSGVQSCINVLDRYVGDFMFNCHVCLWSQQTVLICDIQSQCYNFTGQSVGTVTSQQPYYWSGSCIINALTLLPPTVVMKDKQTLILLSFLLSFLFHLTNIPILLSAALFRLCSCFCYLPSASSELGVGDRNDINLANDRDFHYTHNLQYLLYTYLEHYRLTPRNCSLLSSQSLSERQPWFEMLVRIQEITRDLSDPGLVFQASLTSAQVLLPGSQASLSSLLLEGHSLLTLAAIMFAPGGIDQVNRKLLSERTVDPQLLKMALAPHPKLRAALFPAVPRGNGPPSDISVYHLLQSLLPLDPSRLFGWQAANTLNSTETSELPHFSSAHLVQRFALKENLDYLYFLHHGRPSFAYATFLVQQLSGSGDVRSSYEAAQEWALAVQFCQLHNLQLSSVYPAHCAHDGQFIHFLLFVQLHNFPPQQVRSLAAQFGPTLQAHLSLAFQDLQVYCKKSCDSDEQHSVLRTEEAASGSPERPGEMFQALLQSQEEPAPCRYLLQEAVVQRCPTLAVLAACMQGAELLPCLCVWVLTSVDDVTAEEATSHLAQAPQHHEWTLHDLSIIWKTLLGRSLARPLLRGFELFQKDCPLVLVLRMFELCCDYRNFAEAKSKLLDFQRTLIALRNGGPAPPGGLPLQWVESQASVLLLTMLQRCSSQYDIHRLLQLLADVDKLLKSNGPDFRKLNQLSQLLQGSEVSISPRLLQSSSPSVQQEEFQATVDALQARGCYSRARQVAQLAGLPVHRLLLSQVHTRSKRQWGRFETRVGFWKKCHEQLEADGTDPDPASQFFLSQAEAGAPGSPEAPEDLLDIQEHCLLLGLAAHWLSRIAPAPVDKLESLEKAQWLSRIRKRILTVAMEKESVFNLPPAANPEMNTHKALMKEFSFSNITQLNGYLGLEGLPGPSDEQEEPNAESALSPEERSVLAALIGQLLDDGSIHEASRVCRYFSLYHPDVWLVLRCRGLASGELSDEPQEDGAEAPARASLTSSPSVSSLSSFVMLPLPEDEVAVQLQKLVDQCRHGNNYCKQVLSLYQLCKELQCSFSSVCGEEPCSVLEKLLLSEQPERFRKARAFVKAQGLSADAVAELISSAMVQALLASSQELHPGERHIFRPLEGRDALVQLIKLCDDPNLVGLKLLEHLNSVPLRDLNCIVELLIMAHDCFSLTCNMEGIVRVLQAARHLIITPELKSSLVKVLGLLKDAAESFSKDSCVRQATRCIRTAKLVALQLHFLNQGSDLRIINLRPAELLSAAMALPRCYQVFVVSEAYGYSPDWAEILYQKVVLHGDFGYLEELKRHRPLTSALFEDIFKKLDGAPGSVTSNVKRLLTYCDDVYSRYRLAYQQNLHDITKMLLQDAKTSSYLSDRLGS